MIGREQTYKPLGGGAERPFGFGSMGDPWPGGQSSAPGAYKAVFLVGDAPPHMDYQDDTPYAVTLNAARRQRMCAGPMPQQPPIRRAPRSTQPRASRR